MEELSGQYLFAAPAAQTDRGVEMPISEQVFEGVVGLKNVTW